MTGEPMLVEPIEAEPAAEHTFDAVFAREYVLLVRLATAVCGDVGAAEEVTQEAFTAAWRRWDQLDRPGAYLRRAVTNGAIDATRRRGRSDRRQRDLRVVTAVTVEAPIDPLWDLIDALPDVRRAVVVLRFYADLTIPEIAEITGRPLNTVKTDLRRALATLAAELRDPDEEY